MMTVKSHLVWLALFGAVGPLFAQPSLLQDDTREVSVEIDGQRETITLIRDAFEPKQWFYVPNRPRLAQKKIGTKSMPEFTLIKYTTPDQKNPGRLEEGSLLQFGITLALPEKAREQLVEKAANAAKVAKTEIRLAALPIKAATVHLIVPKTGLLIGSASLGEGTAPTFATQKMVFCVPLTGIGTDVFQKLVTEGATGIGVAAVLKYDGVTPKAGFKITVNWKQTFEHFSSENSFRAQASFFGLFGGGAAISSRNIFENLKTSKCITVEGVIDPELKIDTYLQAVLSRINQELLDNFKPPEKVEPAKAGEPPTAKGLFGSAGFSRATVKKTARREGTETFDFSLRRIAERATVAGDFVGIQDHLKKFPADRKDLILFADRAFRGAVLSLPAIGDEPNWDLREIRQIITLKSGGEEKQSFECRWRQGGDWTVEGVPSKLVTVELKDLDLTKTQFEIQTSIQRKGQKAVETTTTIPARYRMLVADPLETVRVVKISSNLLTWDPKGEKLTRVHVTLTSGDQKLTTSLEPPTGKDVVRAVYWLVGGDKPIMANLSFQVGGRQVQWKHNGDLGKAFPSLAADLLDEDWMKPSGTRKEPK